MKSLVNQLRSLHFHLIDKNGKIPEGVFITMKIENRPAKFSGASHYVLDDELAKIVNISIALEMPLTPKASRNGKNHAGARNSGKPCGCR